jgi:hypothetical protein
MICAKENKKTTGKIAVNLNSPPLKVTKDSFSQPPTHGNRKTFTNNPPPHTLSRQPTAKTSPKQKQVPCPLPKENISPMVAYATIEDR